jgi:hypothetical protein
MIESSKGGRGTVPIQEQETRNKKLAATGDPKNGCSEPRKPWRRRESYGAV